MSRRYDKELNESVSRRSRMPDKMIELSNGVKVSSKTYDRLLLIRDDYLKGMSKSEIRKAFFEGKYCDLSKCSMDSSVRLAWTRDWKRMIDVFQDDIERSSEVLIADFMGKYNHLYKEAVKKGNIREARSILDSMSKLAGLTDGNQTNIQVNALNDGVTINFGFDNNIVKDNNAHKLSNQLDNEAEGSI